MTTDNIKMLQRSIMNICETYVKQMKFQQRNRKSQKTEDIKRI